VTVRNTRGCERELADPLKLTGRGRREERPERGLRRKLPGGCFRLRPGTGRFGTAIANLAAQPPKVIISGRVNSPAPTGLPPPGASGAGLPRMDASQGARPRGLRRTRGI